MHRLRPQAPKARHRSATALAVLAVVIAGQWAFGATAASAHYPTPQARAECAADAGRIVHYTVESWLKDEAGGGANPHIDVAYQVADGGVWKTLPWEDAHSFSAANAFTFGDTFWVAALGGAQVRIKAWTTAAWSDGNVVDDVRYSDWVALPCDCVPVTTTSTTTTTLTPDIPATTTTTTTVPETTIEVSPTTIVNTTTTVPVPTDAVAGTSLSTVVAVRAAAVGQLPVTGSRTFEMVALAGALLLLGSGLLVRSIRSRG